MHRALLQFSNRVESNKIARDILVAHDVDVICSVFKSVYVDICV